MNEDNSTPDPDPIDTAHLRAAFVIAQAQMMNEGKRSKDLALRLLDELDRRRQMVVDQGAEIDHLRRGVWVEIVAERERAHAKHGATSMESCDRFADRRFRVLGEELGEVAEVLNDREHFARIELSSVALEAEARWAARLRSELVQVAAMAVAWIAAIDGESLA